EVALEELDDWQVGRRLTVRDRSGFEHEPALQTMRVRQLIDQPGLADAGFPNDRSDLTAAARGELHGPMELLHLGIATDELRESTHGGGLKTVADGAGADGLEHIDGLDHTLHRYWTEGLDFHVALHEGQRCRCHHDGARVRQLLHTRGQVGRLPD